MARVKIEIIVYGSKKDKDVKVIMGKICDKVFRLDDYNVQHVIIKRDRIEKLIRWIRIKRGRET